MSIRRSGNPPAVSEHQFKSLKRYKGVPKTQAEKVATLESKNNFSKYSLANFMGTCSAMQASIFSAGMASIPTLGALGVGVGSASGMMNFLSGMGIGGNSYYYPNQLCCNQQQETGEVSIKDMFKNAGINLLGNIFTAFGLSGTTTTQNGKSTGINSLFRIC